MNKRLWSFLLLMLLLLAGCASPKTEPAGQPATPRESSARVDSAAAPGTPPASNRKTGPESTPTRENSVLQITEEENGGLAALMVNDTLQVTINGVPSTGFAWEPDNLDTSLLEQQGEPTFTSTSNLKGGGGNFVFTFKALKVGITHLRLIYHRPFEKETPPERIYDVTVEIQE